MPIRAPLQSAYIEAIHKARRRLADAMRRQGIGWIVADHAIKQPGRIGDAAGHGTERAGNRRPTGENSAPADQSGGGTHTDDTVPDRWAPDRGKALLPHGNGAEIGRHAHGGAARRTARRSLEIINIARRTEERAMRVAAAHFPQRRFAEENGTRRPQFGRDEAVALRPVALEQNGAQGRRHFFDVRLILHNDRNAVQGTDEAIFFQRRVEAVGFREGVWIERNNGIERRALLIIGRDPVKIGLNELPCAQYSRAIGRLNIGDRRLQRLEGHECSPLRIQSSWHKPDRSIYLPG